MPIIHRDRIPLIIGATAAAAITAAALIVSTASAAPPGDAAPAFKELNTAGKEISLADFKGKMSKQNNADPWVYTRAQYAKMLMKKNPLGA